MSLGYDRSVDYLDIYAQHADTYDELVTAEDADGHLLPALVSAISRSLEDDDAPSVGLDDPEQGGIMKTAGALQRPLAGVRIVEIGAGTGRITRLLARAGARVHATEPAAAMLAVAKQRIGNHPRVTLEQASAETLPMLDGWADAAIAGWVFGHFRSWMPASWQLDINRALVEVARVVRPGGTVVIIETLGTGSSTPAPPNQDLAEYYSWLEETGFTRTWIRTDYAFPDVDTAVRLTSFFFGDEFGDRVRASGGLRVPECTGVWIKRLPPA